MNALELKVPPPVVTVIIALAMRATALALPVFTLDLPGHKAAGLALAALGLLLEVAAVITILWARTSVNPMRPRSTSRLVSSGVYRYSRNPIYLGDLIVLVAWAIYLSSPVTLVLTPLFVLYLNRFQIAPEERILSAIFGADYAAYQARVRRWL